MRNQGKRVLRLPGPAARLRIRPTPPTHDAEGSGGEVLSVIGRPRYDRALARGKVGMGQRVTWWWRGGVGKQRASFQEVHCLDRKIKALWREVRDASGKRDGKDGNRKSGVTKSRKEFSYRV